MWSDASQAGTRHAEAAVRLEGPKSTQTHSPSQAATDGGALTSALANLPTVSITGIARSPLTKKAPLSMLIVCSH
ncbi:unnamed protein product [Parajaminaea phylloscopi]